MDNQLKVIQEQLAKDSDLLNELYNQERCEINPRRKLQLRQEIEQLNQNMRDRENQIEQRKQELKAKENQLEKHGSSVEASPPKSDVLPRVIRRPLIRNVES